MPPRSREEIKRYLVKQDRKLRPLIKQIAFPVAGRNRDVYATLLHSIIAQQLSVKAASTIHARVIALFPLGYPDPGLLYKMPVTRLRSAGLSRQKADYLKAIARFALDEGLDYPGLARYSDEQLMAHLTSIHGVGRWTVEMLLMFSFNRRDVFSVADVGIQNAMQRLYSIEEKGRRLQELMLRIAENWRPYRAVVCKYLWKWKALDYP